MLGKLASVEKQYNCKIKIARYDSTGGTGKGVVKNSIIAGKPLVDIWETQWFDWLPAYVAGLIQPLDSFKCFDFTDKTKYSNPVNDTMVINGVHYGVNFTQTSFAFNYDQMLYFRYDVLQKSGVTNDMMPNVLADKGQWTWDNFAKDCQKVRAAGYIPLQDYTGSVGMNQVNLYQDICYTYGTDYIAQDPTSKKVTFNGGSPTALQALNYYITLVKNKTIDAPVCDKPIWDMINVDNIAFSPEQTWAAKWLYPRWGTEISKSSWGMVYLPKVKASDPYTVVSDEIVGGTAIPYGVKNPFDAATVLQAITPMDTDVTALKAETIMDFELWLPSNQTMADSVLKIENEINALSVTSSQKFVITALGDGPGVRKDWLTHIQKIGTGQEDAATAIKANTNKYNDMLKNLYVLR
jgi:ABC-type glycerol-3-phosphate transport system substrate-binding protein